MHYLRAVLDFLRYRVGHRGAFLLFLTLLDLLYGFAMVTNQVSDVPITFLSWHEWGMLWMAAGVFIFTGVASKVDKAQYTVAIILKTAWAAALIVDSWDNHIVGGWVDAAVWGMVVAVVFLISSWPEPPKRRRGGG